MKAPSDENNLREINARNMYRLAYNSVANFIRLAVVVSEMCEILRKFELIVVQGHPSLQGH